MAHKIGLHINQLNTQSQAQLLVTDWHIVKFMGCIDYPTLANLKAKNPNVITVGRLYFTPEQQSSFNADAVVQAILAVDTQARNLIDYWETYNEVSAAPDDIAGWQRISNFYSDVTNKLHQNGMKSCVLSLGVGNPSGTDAQIKTILNILWSAVSIADAWSYHSYGAPSLDSSSAYFDLRYRNYVSLDPRYGTKNLILSEFGIDFGEIPGSRGGWLRNNITAVDYSNEIINFSKEIQSDSYVLGATLYQCGDWSDPNSWQDGAQTWGSFATTDELIYLIKNGIDMTTPPPVTEPVIDPDIAYFEMYGFKVDPNSALYKFAMKELRNLYRELLVAGQVNRANLVNPGPATSAEYAVVENGVTKYRRNLSNRVLEVQVNNGIWTPYQAEFKPK